MPSLNLGSSPQTLELFGPGLISTEFYERDLAISPGGDEIIFTLGDYKQYHRVLVTTKRIDGQWTTPEVLSFSGTHQDIEPFLSHDGKRLYFASNRPMHGETENGDYNIWYADRSAGSWGTPRAIDTIVNTDMDEFFPAVSANNNLYFTATREDGMGREDIYRAQWNGDHYLPPAVLDSAINTPAFEFNAYISPAEDLLIFSSYGRADGMGGGDLYISLKDEFGNWGNSRNLGGAVNSEFLDYCPFVDWPRRNLYFTSERVDSSAIKITGVPQLKNWADKHGNGLGDIYRISMDQLNPQ